jgi:hypothetical protein
LFAAALACGTSYGRQAFDKGCNQTDYGCGRVAF